MKFHCLICLSDTYAKEDKKGRIYHFCTKCHFVSLDQSFYLSHAGEKERYNLHNNNSENEGYRKWLMTFLDQAVRPYINKKSRILDFGSGPNPLLKEILENDGFVVDIFDKHFYDHLYSGLYNMIISTEVIEHIRNPLEQVRKLKTHLKQEAFLSLKTLIRPDSDEDFLKWWYKEDKTHISFFSTNSISLMAQKAELAVHFCDNKSIIILKN